LKTNRYHTRVFITLLTVCYLFAQPVYGQASGRVVINEYMPWTLNGCGATSEFVELMNFGPGPVNIGCYVLTDGDFSVTIPPNTILQPGEFYLIAGQSVIPVPCANIDSAVTADLNWNTCGCTSGAIPTTGDGFFTDGGGANEQVVLLDPALKVIDAVIRALPAEPSSPISTSGVGGCTSRSFNLDTMAVNYEVLGMSAGRGNSFARKLDGDCGWVKDPQQSGNATNNTPGETSNVAYDFSIVKSMDCDSTHGSINVNVNVGSNTDVFPMNYTIAFDSNGDGLFTLSDTYTYGTDNTPPSITILGLPLGTYRITVSSSKGCFLRTFPFTILDCSSVLPAQLVYFNLLSSANNEHTFEWMISGIEDMKEIILEGSNGATFIDVASVEIQGLTGTKHFTQYVSATGNHRMYRLRLLGTNGKISYSRIIPISSSPLLPTMVWPNPATDKISLQFNAAKKAVAKYKLYNISGSVVAEGIFQAQVGNNILQVPVQQFAKGMYQLVINFDGKTEPIQFRFVKQ
jgi:hypothetical protein